MIGAEWSRLHGTRGFIPDHVVGKMTAYRRITLPRPRRDRRLAAAAVVMQQLVGAGPSGLFMPGY